MYTVSDRFLQRIRNSGKTRTVVDLYFEGSLVASDIPISEGQIRVSRGSDSRRSGSLTIPDPSLVPAIKSDLLIPYGTEIRIKSGVVYPDGEELVPMGVFNLEETSWDEGQDSIPQIEFFDRTKALQRFSYTVSLDVSGKYAKTMIPQVVNDVFKNGTVATNIAAALPDIRFPGGTVYDMDAWGIIGAMVEAMGGEVYLDVNGDVQVVTPPFIDTTTPQASAVWTVDVGDQGVLISARRGISRADTYNSVVCRGGTKTNGKQAWGRVYDLNPGSPTYYNGPFGRTRRIIENSAVTTDAQCTAIAMAELRKVTGLAKSVSFTSLRNPALEVGDILLFEFFDSETELHILDGFTYDFASGEMSAETRAQVVNL